MVFSNAVFNQDIAQYIKKEVRFVFVDPHHRIYPLTPAAV
jgi:hypothetical protein